MTAVSTSAWERIARRASASVRLGAGLVHSVARRNREADVERAYRGALRLKPRDSQALALLERERAARAAPPGSS